jgi:predicted kinase
VTTSPVSRPATLPRPVLVVVSGPVAAGKTTLAHRLAHSLGCPAICRDEIKEGMVRASPGFVASEGDELTKRTLPVFFGVVGLLVRAGVSTVAEAAFQDHVWRPGLEPLLELSDLRIVQCFVPAEVALRRARERSVRDPVRRAHADPDPERNPADFARRYAAFARLSVDAPSIDVDTTDGYRPEVRAITQFVRSAVR